MNTLLSSLLVAFVFLLTANNVVGAAHFQGLGDLPGGDFYSQARAVSADGSTIVGYSSAGNEPEAFRWTSSTGMQPLGFLPNGLAESEGYGVSADGSVVVGNGYSSSTQREEAFRWTSANQMTPLGYIGGGNVSVAFGVSSDGTAVAGFSNAPSVTYEGFRWTPASGTVGIGSFGNATNQSFGRGISGDGSVIVGDTFNSNGTSLAMRWTSAGGIQPILTADSSAEAISGNGTYVVGYGPSEAFRWTQANGSTILGDLPGGADSSQAYAVSNNGTIVGYGTSSIGQEAFIWDPQNGMRNLRQVLTGGYGLNLTGWILNSAFGISANGLVITGTGTDPQGNTEAWVAVVPEPGMAGMSTMLFFAITLYSRATRHTPPDRPILLRF